MKTITFLSIIALLFIGACKESINTNQAGSGTKMEETTKPFELVKLWETDTLLTTAESVIFDAKRGVLYVSCINGVPPWDNDGDGFISKLDLNGKILDLKWVTGLNGPKGMGVYGDILYVNDNDRLVKIDILTHKIIGKEPIESAKNLNDIAVANDGTLCLSDSKTSTLYEYSNDKFSMIVSDTLLGGLNGVLALPEGYLSVGFVSGDLFRFKKDLFQPEKLTGGLIGGDGLVAYKDGYIVTSWHGAVYFVDANWEVHELINTTEEKVNAADIELILSQDILLVPTFFDNKVVAYRIKSNNS